MTYLTMNKTNQCNTNTIKVFTKILQPYLDNCEIVLNYDSFYDYWAQTINYTIFSIIRFYVISSP